MTGNHMADVVLILFAFGIAIYICAAMLGKMGRNTDHRPDHRSVDRDEKGEKDKPSHIGIFVNRILASYSDAQETAALRILKEHGILSVYSTLGSPEEEIVAEEKKIAKLREWVDTLDDASEQAAFRHWLNYAEKCCHESRNARLAWERSYAVEKIMSKPPR